MHWKAASLVCPSKPLNGRRELAMNMVKPLIPAPTISDKLQALQVASDYLLSQGKLCLALDTAVQHC